MTPTNPGPFQLLDNTGRVVGAVVIDSEGARVSLVAMRPMGRQDLRKIGHRLMNIADYDTGLFE